MVEVVDREPPAWMLAELSAYDPAPSTAEPPLPAYDASRTEPLCACGCGVPLSLLGGPSGPAPTGKAGSTAGLWTDLAAEDDSCPAAIPGAGSAVPVPVPVPGSVEDGWAVPGVWLQPEDAGPSGLPAVSADLAELARLAERLTAIDPASLPEAQAWVDANALLAVAAVLRRCSLTRIADVTTRQLHGLAGLRSPRAWLSADHPDVVPTDLPLAKDLRHAAALARAVASGSVSLAAARKVTAALSVTARYVDRPDGLVDGQPGEEVIGAVVGHVVDLVAESRLGLEDHDPLLADLLERTASIAACAGSQQDRLDAGFALLAEHLPVAGLPVALDRLVCAVVPSLLEDRERSGHERRALSLALASDGSGWDVRGFFDLETGERLWTALRAEAGRDPDNPADTSAAEALRLDGIDPYGLDPVLPADSLRDSCSWELTEPGTRRPRTRPQRMHDAFSNLLGRYLEQGLGGTRDKQPVQVVVSTSSEQLDREPGALPPLGDSGARVPGSLVRRLVCDARLTAFVLSRGGKALREVLTTRTLPGSQRRALDLETGKRCAGVGCCTPGDPLTVLAPHHVIDWASTGRTTLAETVWACPALHHDLHTGKKSVRLRNGRWLNETGWTDPPPW